MTVESHTLRHYRTLLDQLDPESVPRACLIHKAPCGINHPGKKLGILDASFNPMTLAHTRMIEETCQTLGMDEMLLMLSRSNVDKEIFGASLEQRLAMLVGYASSHPYLSIAGCSHARFVDKVHSLKPLYPDNTAFYFILGYDTLTRLFDPKYYMDMSAELQALFDACQFVAANRASFGAPQMKAFMEKPECRAFADRVHFIQLEASYGNISSTQVRERRQNGASIADLVPLEIADQIKSMNLYL
mgnify:FL=1